MIFVVVHWWWLVYLPTYLIRPLQSHFSFNASKNAKKKLLDDDDCFLEL